MGGAGADARALCRLPAPVILRRPHVRRKLEAAAAAPRASRHASIPPKARIAWLRRRKDRDGEAMISQAQFDAGERLRADFWFAQMTPRAP